MFPVGMLLGSLILTILPQREKVYKSLVSSLFAYSILIITVGIVTSEKLFVLKNTHYLVILMVLYVLIAISAMFVNIPINMVIQKLIPDDKRGRITGILRTFTLVFTPVGTTFPICCGIHPLYGSSNLCCIKKYCSRYRYFCEGTEGRRIVILNSIVTGITITALTTTLNTFNYGLEKMGGISGIALVAIVTFVSATLLVYIAFKFLYMINKKRQEQLDDKYNDEDE